jgi:2-polyprenyl-3-methyl-5-hydroxy-6-metoxy-1,4-benzoquinol methylase
VPVPREWNARADELSAEAIAEGRPTAWFDDLYAAGAAGEVTMPWERDEPNVHLEEWAEREAIRGEGRRAVVVGCGLGADAEYLATLGYDVTGFDISPNAVRLAAERHPGTTVTYVVGDLLDLPEEWRHAFDLVVEIFTLQAVPDPPRTEMAAGVRSLVAPGGTLLAIQFRYDGTEPLDQGPPFPQPRELFDQTLAADGLALLSLEELDGPRWRAELHREG